MFNDPRDNNTGGNAAAAFDVMSVRNRAYLVTVIRLFLRPAKAINRKHTSYGLKHLAEKLMPGGYVSNGEMKGAMLYCGYKAGNTRNTNWTFNVYEHSELFTAAHHWSSQSMPDPMRAAVNTAVEDMGVEAALKMCQGCALDLEAAEKTANFYEWVLKKYYGKNTPRGDFALDMRCDREFPRVDDRKAIIIHLERLNACPEAIAVFKNVWRSYQKYCFHEGGE